MGILRYLFSISFIALAIVSQAQDISVTVDCPRIVRVGEPFQMSVKVNAEAINPKVPTMSAFTIVRNAGRQHNSQAYFSGGRWVQTTEVVFNYVVVANTEGTHEVGAFEITIGSSVFRSAPFSVQVVASNANTTQQQQQQQSGQGTQISGEEVYVQVLTDRRQVYQGEYINASVKLFSRLPVARINNVEAPTFDGFFIQNIDTPPLRQLEQENINGVAHLTGVLQRYVIFPQRSGSLTISPAKMEVGINQRVQRQARSIIDEFFGGGGVQTVPREIASRPVTITVLPLPDGRPESFSGGVGQMRLNVNVSQTDVKAHDAITLKVTVSGNGNLRFVDAPRINFPPSFEVYDPRITNQLNAATTTGSRTFEYLVIPRHGGTYKIPSIEFSYFDPQDKRYKTLLSEEYTITVERGEDQPTMIGGVTREDIRRMGYDINYIKTGKIELHKLGDNFFGTWKFWLWYILPMFAFALVIYLRRNYMQKYSDIAKVKNRRANRYASKKLKKARKFIEAGQKEKFYEELLRAMWGYLSDKLNIPVSQLSRENVKAIFEQQKIDNELADRFISVIDDCEFARYAPSAAESDMNTLYDKAVNCLKTF
jgi:hypothetical protein